MSSQENVICGICKDVTSKYTCPKCNIAYCSLLCYRSQTHMSCSEEFYKEWVENKLKLYYSENQGVPEMLDMLKRVNQGDPGCIPTDSDDDEQLHSDNDNSAEERGEYDEGGAQDDSDDEKDIQERLKGVDLNNCKETWNCLTAEERKDFNNQVRSGEIMKLLPSFNPWWLSEPPKIEEVKRQAGTSSKIVGDTNKENRQIPSVASEIPPFLSLCKKEPSPCVHYNLWNIIAAYGCTVRYFRGDHLAYPEEATAIFINLSATMKYCTNFEDVEDALKSVETEAIGIGSELKPEVAAGTALEQDFFCGRDQLTHDAQKLMFTLQFKAAALSEILLLFRMTQSKLDKKDKQDINFEKMFNLLHGNVAITPSKVAKYMKKIEFMLSYTMRDNTK